jgi:hypothetical protein
MAAANETFCEFVTYLIIWKKNTCCRCHASASKKKRARYESTAERESNGRSMGVQVQRVQQCSAISTALALLQSFYIQFICHLYLKYLLVSVEVENIVILNILGVYISVGRLNIRYYR